jgi:integrase/recombinase XerD
VGGVLDEWLAWLKVERGLAPNTRRSYQRHVEALRGHYGGRLEDLSTGELRLFLSEAGGGPASVLQRIAAFRSFFRFLLVAGARADDPTAVLSRPKLPRSVPRPVEQQQLIDLRAQSPRGFLIAVFLVGTGLRIGEAIEVRTGLPAPAELVVRGKGNKERRVPLLGPARQALEQLGGRLPWGVRHTERIFRRAGFNPHRCRAAFACAMGDADVDLSVVQDLLGHASANTTRFYLKNSPRRLREGVERGAAELPLPGMKGVGS